ncbi:MAG: zinc metallopeptidase [Clostridiales bacterium]|nr:zinc metallopeptidase [Clostridiales bacterium]
MYLYGFDVTYIVIVLPFVIFALWAQANVKSTFAKYSKVPISGRNMTGYDSARRILDANGLYSVGISHVDGELTDHYNPSDNTIYLSSAVYSSSTASAVGVAAHEAGHAVQHAIGYAPMKVRSAIIPATQIGSTVAMPLILIGIVLSFQPLALIGVIAFAMSTLFQLVTLPVEFDASARAIKALDGAGLTADDLDSSRKVLRAAALTYVAALAVSLANLLRLVLIVTGRNNRRND